MVRLINDHKINLGCGTDKKEGYINVDSNPEVYPDMLADLMKPLPFEDNSVDEVLAWNVMEHLPGLHPMYLLREVYRILKPEGVFKFRVPMANTITAHIAIDHISSFTPRSFECKPWHKYNFKRKIRLTLPLFHKIKFPEWCWYFNYIYSNLFTGIEGELIKNGR